MDFPGSMQLGSVFKYLRSRTRKTQRQIARARWSSLWTWLGAFQFPGLPAWAMLAGIFASVALLSLVITVIRRCMRQQEEEEGYNRLSEQETEVAAAVSGSEQQQGSGCCRCIDALVQYKDQLVSKVPNDWQTLGRICLLAMFQSLDTGTDLRAVAGMLATEHGLGYGICNLAAILIGAPFCTWVAHRHNASGSLLLPLPVLVCLHSLQVLPIVLASWATYKVVNLSRAKVPVLDESVILQSQQDFQFLERIRAQLESSGLLDAIVEAGVSLMVQTLFMGQEDMAQSTRTAVLQSLLISLVFLAKTYADVDLQDKVSESLVHNGHELATVVGRTPRVSVGFLMVYVHRMCDISLFVGLHVLVQVSAKQHFQLKMCPLLILTLVLSVLARLALVSVQNDKRWEQAGLSLFSCYAPLQMPMHMPLMGWSLKTHYILRVAELGVSVVVVLGLGLEDSARVQYSIVASLVLLWVATLGLAQSLRPEEPPKALLLSYLRAVTHESIPRGRFGEMYDLHPGGAIEELHRAHTKQPDFRQDRTSEELEVELVREDYGEEDDPVILLERIAREPSSVRTINVKGYTDLEQLLRLAEELPKCSQLRACKIEIIRDAETLRRLLQGLRGAVGGGALQLLRFEGCKKIGSDEAVMNELCETLRAHQNSLAGLTLRYCGITSNGAKQLKEALKQCRQLRSFAMIDNKGDDGLRLLDAEAALSLFAAFASKDSYPSLVYVDLARTIKEPLLDMSEKAQLAIAKVFFTSTTLRIAGLDVSSGDGYGTVVERRDAAPLCQSALLQHFSGCKVPKDLAHFLIREGAFRWMHSLEELDLSDCKLEDEKCAAVAEALQPSAGKLRVVDLYKNEMGPGAAARWAEVLRSAEQLEEIDFCENRHIGDEGAQAIAGALLEGGRCSSLKRIKLNEIGIKDAGAQAIAAALPSCSALEAIDLSDNGIEDAGAQTIAAALPSCPSLNSIDLRFNGIEDVGAQAIAAALPSCPSLNKVDLMYNRITVEQDEKIRDVLQRECPDVQIRI